MNFDFNFLKSKGFFDDENLIDKLEEKDYKILVDRKNKLVYCEFEPKDSDVNKKIIELKKIIENKLTKRYEIIWFYIPSENRVKAYRRYGEIRWFYFNPKISRVETLRSKIEKLKKFSLLNMNILFDIKDIEKRFYDELWEIRITIASSIKDLKNDNLKLLIAQRFIDRSIFLFFISQLGLIKIRIGDEEYRLDKFKSIGFFQKILNEFSESDLLKFFNALFFDVLGKVTQEGFSSLELKINGKNYQIVAPPLNGGLFSEETFENKKEREIKISGIKRLLGEIFLTYNWIVGEEIPEREDVVGDLTPEVIGHVYERFVVSLEQLGVEKLKSEKIDFEKLREARKKIGAYYTPEEITNYISRNTIFPIIKDKLVQKFGKEGAKFFKKFFSKEDFSKDEIQMLKYLCFEILSKIKICDNACGSGSFLIAAGNILLRLYSGCIKLLKKYIPNDEEVKAVLEEIEKAPSRNYYIVRKIILDNIYGVDIMEGAVDIARLRLWLWLISQVRPEIEKKKIETLPNLDFNLMVGNSLIGFVDIEDVEFDFLRKQKTLSAWLGDNKIEWLKNLAKQKQKFKTLPAHEAIKLKEKLSKDLEKARELLNEKFYKMLQSKGIEISKEEFLKLKPFHWGFEFYEVFDLEKPKEERGFDVIIGNPPYVRQEKIKGDKPILSNLFETFESTADIFVYFIERSIQIAHKKGYFSYIVSNKWLRTKYAVKLRRFLLNKTTVLKIIDFAGIKVFSDPTVDVCIFVLKKDVMLRNHKIFCARPNSIENLTTQINQRGFYLDQSYLENSDVWGLYRPEILEIKEWIEKVGKPLKDLNVKIYRGILTGFNEAFIIDEETKRKLIEKDPKNKEIIVPIVRGRDIYRYYIKWQRLYLILSKSGMRVDKEYHIVFEYLKQYKKQLEKRWDKGKYWFNLRECAYYEDFEKPKIIWQEISEKGSYYWDKQNFFVTNTAYIMTNAQKYFLPILNSKLMDFYFEKIAYSLSSKGLRHIYQFVELQPIRIPLLQQPFIILADYMLFLNAREERRAKEKELIEFIDRQIIDSLVYELYFKEKFEQDGIKTNLLELVEPYLKSINYDKWSEIYWKKQLGEKVSESEEKEMKRLEEENLKIIKEVVEKIKNDKKIINQIEKIKSHPWVKIIEGKEE